MYNKIILENRGEEFAIHHHGVEHIVPVGKFEAEEKLGNFIFGKAKKFKIDVVKIGAPEKPKVTPIEPVIVEVTDEEVKEKLPSKEEKTESAKEEKPKSEKKFGYTI